jgi:CO/xanthine dehydrogenase FAD-binding subunit
MGRFQMITAYHRPKTLHDAMKLLTDPHAYPLGGGVFLNQKKDEDIEVVDLQALGLSRITKSGDRLEIGATASLQVLYENKYIHKALKDAIRLEATINLRNIGTVAGALVACTGRSPFLATFTALDPRITFANDMQVRIGDFLLTRRDRTPGNLITRIEIPLKVDLAYEYVSRTPVDKPIVCAALARWTSGRMRLIIGGWGQAPRLAVDGKFAPGNESSELSAAAGNAARDSLDDWAGEGYRMDVAPILAMRCLESIVRGRSQALLSAVPKK